MFHLSIHRAATPSPKKLGLVVDSDPAFRRLAMRLLARLDVAAVGLASGEAAVEWLDANRRPSIVSLNTLLPAMSGFRVCERIRGIARTADVPVLFASALTELHDHAHALEAGANVFLEKPVAAAEYLAAARALLAGELSIVH